MLVFYILLISIVLGICDAQCWCVQQGKLVQCSWNNDFAFQLCGGKQSGFQTCCSIDDTCESDSICSFSHPQRQGSGFYIAGCTDNTHGDSVCNKHCNDLFFPDIVYNQTSSLWACCQSNGGNDCGNPGKETFYAAAPKDLKEISSSSIISTSSTSSSSSSSSSLSSRSTTTSPLTLASQSSKLNPSPAIATNSANNPQPSSTNCTENHTCSSHLSAGARAGIGIGATLGGLAVLIGGFFIYVSVRRSKPHELNHEIGTGDISDPNRSSYKRQENPFRAELNGADMVHEAPGPTFTELPAPSHDPYR